MEKLEPSIAYTSEHEIPYEVDPSIEEVIDKVNEIIEWINSKKDQLL